MSAPSPYAHARDILILPFTVVAVVPAIIYRAQDTFIPSLMPVRLTGLAVFLSGMGLFFACLQLFATIGKGTLAPWSPTRHLIVSGPYGYCRNPMITGVLTMLLGESLMFHSAHILIWSGCFFFINTIYFLLFEEPRMEERFGEEYRAYKKHVPRWIPRLRRFIPPTDTPRET